jgi:phage shock protein C
MEELRRKTSSARIAGVAAGLANYFNTSPLLFRLLFILAAFWGGTGILIYAILWISLPSDLVPSNTPKPGENDQNQAGKSSNSGGNTLGTGLVLITLGVLFLLETYIPAFYFEKFWPVLLILLGIILLLNSIKYGSSTQNNEALKKDPANQERSGAPQSWNDAT